MAPWIKTKSTATFDGGAPRVVDVVLQRDDELRGGGKAAEARIRVVDGVDGAGVETIKIARRGGRIVTSADVRELNLERIAEDAIAHHATVMQPSGRVAIPADRRAIEDRVHGSKRAPAPDLLRRVARAYLDPANRVDAETGSTIPRNRRQPTERVRVNVLGFVDAFPGQKNGLRSASRRINDARKAGLIPAHDADDSELDAAFAALVEGESNGEAR